MSQNQLSPSDTSIEARQNQIDVAFSKLKTGDPITALDILNSVPSDIPIKDLFFIRALCRLAVGETEAARVEVTKELARFPFSQAAKNLLAQIRVILKDKAQGLPPTTAPESANPIESAQQSLLDGDAATALFYINSAKKQGTQQRGIDLLRARILLAQNHIEDSRRAVREELLLFPDNTLATRFLNDLAATELEIAKANSMPSDSEFLTFISRVQSQSMLSIERLYAAYALARDVCIRRIPGNFIECGVSTGASAAMLAWVITRFSTMPRKVFAFDLYAGQPAPTYRDTIDGQPAEQFGWSAGTSATTEEMVLTIARTSGVDGIIVPVKGLFKDTLVASTGLVGNVALVHSDTLLYNSTKTVLELAFPLLTAGGIIAAQHYDTLKGISAAVQEFRTRLTRRVPFDDLGGCGVLQRP